MKGTYNRSKYSQNEKTDFDNFRTATTAGSSETEAVFSNKFKLFTESLTK